MDKGLLSVILSFVLYLLYVLLPMIPAILIYRLFPDTKVSLKGPLSKLTMKSTGAFAAYIITVILGFFLVKNTLNIITSMAQPKKPTWTVKARVELRDTENNKIDNPQLLKFLVVSIRPEIKTITDDFVQLKLPREQEYWPHNYITFEIPKFGRKTIDISKLSTDDIECDRVHKILQIQNPIMIRADKEGTRPYTPSGNLEPIAPPQGIPTSP